MIFRHLAMCMYYHVGNWNIISYYAFEVSIDNWTPIFGKGLVNMTQVIQVINMLLQFIKEMVYYLGHLFSIYFDFYRCRGIIYCKAVS